MVGSLVVLTGASGSGKTTIASQVQRAHPDCEVFRFDSIGVPSAEVIEAFGTGYQPGGAWQRAMTLQWIERIAPIVQSGHPVLFEGQMRIAFIQEALAQRALPNVHVILVECDDAIRDARLIHNRRQRELANDNMRCWSRYLHNEAVEAGLEIRDTGAESLADIVAHIITYLRSYGTL